MLTVVMYHYVRPLGRTRFPAIKGLDLARFTGQLDHLARHHVVVSIDEVIAALRRETPLPRGAVLLTFDDGTVDHYRYALPALVARGMPAAFYPPAASTLDRRVLDVNKIHFVLASGVAPAQLVAEIEGALAALGPDAGLEPLAAYRARCAEPSRFDTAEVIYVKRMLQRELPLPLRAAVTAELFARHVTADEAAFAEELYVSVDELRVMAGCGMHVGGHGGDHEWLSHLSTAGQAEELDRSLRLLAAVGADAPFTFAYPYGDHDASAVELLAARGCVAAFTTRVALVDLAADDPLRLSRLDTNDFPTDAEAPPSDWTRQATAA